MIWPAPNQPELAGATCILQLDGGMVQQGALTPSLSRHHHTAVSLIAPDRRRAHRRPRPAAPMGRGTCRTSPSLPLHPPWPLRQHCLPLPQLPSQCSCWASVPRDTACVRPIKSLCVATCRPKLTGAVRFSMLGYNDTQGRHTRGRHSE